jgi:hypothetical protein
MDRSGDILQSKWASARRGQAVLHDNDEQSTTIPATIVPFNIAAGIRGTVTAQHRPTSRQIAI